MHPHHRGTQRHGTRARTPPRKQCYRAPPKATQSKVDLSLFLDASNAFGSGMRAAINQHEKNPPTRRETTSTRRGDRRATGAFLREPAPGPQSSDVSLSGRLINPAIMYPGRDLGAVPERDDSVAPDPPGATL